MIIELSDPIIRHHPNIAAKPVYYASLFLFYSFFNLTRATFDNSWMIVEENEIESVYSKPQLILNSTSTVMGLIAIICTILNQWVPKSNNIQISVLIIASIFIQICCSSASLLTFKHFTKQGTIIFLTRGYLALTLSVIIGVLSCILFSIDLIYLRHSDKAIVPSQKKLVFAFFLALLITLFGGFLFQYLEDWTFEQSIQFVIVTLLTIGYGDVSPTQDITKIAVVTFSLFGLVIIGFFVISIGDVIVEKCQYSFFERSLSKNPSTISLSTWSRPFFTHSKLTKQRALNDINLYEDAQPLESRLVSIIIFWVFLYWIGSALIFSFLEEWSIIDGVYFTFVTMTTIGYGDLKLNNPISWEFWYFFIFNAVSIITFVIEGFGHDFGIRLKKFRHDHL
jgi:hypothetical protein